MLVPLTLYPTFEDVVEANGKAVELTAELHDFDPDDEDRLRALLRRVRRTYNRLPEVDKIGRKAALLLYGLAARQCFHEGNKRTAMIICLAFLQRNGYEVELGDERLRRSVDRAAILTGSLKEVYEALKPLIKNVQER